MDYDLNQVANGRHACGSFTDYFAINGWEALKLGAPRKAIEKRVNRLVALAEKRIFLSGYEKMLMEEEGVAGIRRYMKDIIISALTEVGGHPVPMWVQEKLIASAPDKNPNCGGPLGSGTGTYHIANGREVPFRWCSYTNNDGWVQIALTTKIFSFDLAPIRRFRDQDGRLGIWDAWSSKEISWIGLSNDIWFPEKRQAKYMHVARWTSLPGGVKVGEYEYHYDALKADYLNRITAATNGALRFDVAQLK